MTYPYAPYQPVAIATTFTSEFDGKIFCSQITQEQIHTPMWSETEPNPPLPARQAVALAQDCLNGLVPEPDRWKLDEVILHPFGNGRWIYLIQFRGFLPPHILDGPSPRLRIAVLMSGEVIEPVVTDRAPR